MLQIKIKKVNPLAKTPTYAHGFQEDVGLDLYSVEQVVLLPGEGYAVRTGISLEIPPLYEGQVRSRGSLANEGIIVANSPGTIDPGYRGEVVVLLHNIGQDVYGIRIGDRIAQLVVHSYEPIDMVEVEEPLSKTRRGSGKLGSTGK